MRPLRHILLISVVMGLGACAGGPAKPALSPQGSARAQNGDLLQAELVARAHLMSGEAEAAITVLRSTALRGAAPDRQWPLLNLLGIAHDRLGQRDAAREAYRRALSVKPDQPAVLNNLALSLALTGEVAEARRLLARASLTQEAPSQARNNLTLLSRLEPVAVQPISIRTTPAFDRPPARPAQVQTPLRLRPVTTP